MDRRRVLGGLAVTGFAALVGCSERSTSQNAPTGSASPTAPASTGPTAEPTSTGSKTSGPPRPAFDRVIATGLNVPWGIAFLGSDEALVSERDEGDIVRVSADGDVSRVRAVPGVVAGTGEGGLLGIALDPRGRHLYVYLSTSSDNRVVRMRWNGSGLGDPSPVLTGIPRSTIHNGGRLVFGPDGLLYVSTGEAGVGSRAQDTDSLGGKILRVRPDGKPVASNPFGNEVFSYGHRNVEGLAFDADGRLWASEFGDSKSDELNLIRKGGNYGWPEVEGRSDGSTYVDPKVTWPTDECSPSGLAIARSTAFLGALQGECVYTVRLRGTRAAESGRLLDDEYGRIRSIEPDRDGGLWVSTSNTDGRGDPGPKDDQILRLSLS